MQFNYNTVDEWWEDGLKHSPMVQVFPYRWFWESLGKLVSMCFGKVR